LWCDIVQIFDKWILVDVLDEEIVELGKLDWYRVSCRSRDGQPLKLKGQRLGEEEYVLWPMMMMKVMLHLLGDLVDLRV